MGPTKKPYKELKKVRVTTAKMQPLGVTNAVTIQKETSRRKRQPTESSTPKPVAKEESTAKAVKTSRKPRKARSSAKTPPKTEPETEDVNT